MDDPNRIVLLLVTYQCGERAVQEHIWLKVMLFIDTDQHRLLFIDILRCDLYYNDHSTFTSFSTSSTINVAIVNPFLSSMLFTL